MDFLLIYIVKKIVLKGYQDISVFAVGPEPDRPDSRHCNVFSKYKVIQLP